MTNLYVGARVQWTHNGETRTGTVTSLAPLWRNWATVRRDGGTLQRVASVRLTRITDTAIVQAVAAMPHDDQDREDVIAMLKNAGAVR